MHDPDAVIVSDRLELPLLSLNQLDRVSAGDVASVATELRASLSGEWLEQVRWLAGMRARQIRERPTDAPWLLRPVLLAETRHAIGYLNFHGGPDASGTVEVGYTLLPAARGNGYALEAVRAAFDWATHVHGIRHFRASVAPDNERSLNLIRKLGFVKTGEQMDPEDGLEYVHELEV